MKTSQVVIGAVAVAATVGLVAYLYSSSQGAKKTDEPKTAKDPAKVKRKRKKSVSSRATPSPASVDKKGNQRHLTL